MGRVIDVCIECNSEIGVWEFEETLFCVECSFYLHPYEVVKRYV